MDDRKKILCVCEGGNNRSVGLARLIKPQYDALACGWRHNSEATMLSLLAWADKVVLVQPYFVDHLPTGFAHKFVIYDVGPDVYGSPVNPDLLAKFQTYLKTNPL